MSDASTARSPGPRSLSTAAGAGDQATRRRQMVLLGVLGVVFAALVVYVVLPAIFTGGPAAPTTRAAQPAAAGAGPRLEVVEVHLDRLQAESIAPVDGGRDPFRLGAATPPPSAATAAGAQGSTPRVAVPAGPPAAPPIPPIPFRFIGIVTGSGATRIAVLSDGRAVVHGREGAIVDGRYRIVKIGEESIQMEHLDGRGRQTIRLSGQAP